MISNLWFLPVTLLCVFFSVLMFVHIIRSWDSKEKTSYKKINEIVYALLTLGFGLGYPLMIVNLAADHPGLLFDTAVEEFTFLGNLLICGVMTGIFLWALSAKIRVRKNPKLMKTQNNYEAFCEQFLKEYPEKNHIKRKITHILPVAVVAGCVVMFSFLRFFNGAWIDYALFFVIIIGVDFALTFLLQDLIRLFDFTWMPPNAIRMCSAGLTPDELDSFSSTAVMVWSFAPFLFFSFPIFFIVLLITAVADAMASIFGILAPNKHIFPKDTDKSIEGYIGGFLSSFLCVVFGAAFSNFFGLSTLSMGFTLSISLLVALVFVLIDLITSKVKLQDNYVNPFITGLILILVFASVDLAVFYG